MTLLESVYLSEMIYRTSLSGFVEFKRLEEKQSLCLVPLSVCQGGLLNGKQ